VLRCGQAPENVLFRDSVQRRGEIDRITGGGEASHVRGPECNVGTKVLIHLRRGHGYRSGRSWSEDRDIHGGIYAPRQTDQLQAGARVLHSNLQLFGRSRNDPGDLTRRRNGRKRSGINDHVNAVAPRIGYVAVGADVGKSAGATAVFGYPKGDLVDVPGGGGNRLAEGIVGLYGAVKPAVARPDASWNRAAVAILDPAEAGSIDIRLVPANRGLAVSITRVRAGKTGID
jgi:hypothetical protein